MNRARPRLRLVRSADRHRVLRIEGTILRLVRREHRRVLATAARMVKDQLEPVDSVEAKLFLEELRQGALP